MQATTLPEMVAIELLVAVVDVDVDGGGGGELLAMLGLGDATVADTMVHLPLTHVAPVVEQSACATRCTYCVKHVAIEHLRRVK